MKFPTPGKALESAVLASQRGVVAVVKIPNAIRHLPGGRVVKTKAPVDFGGTIVATGRAIWIDAKVCCQANRFVASADHLPPHQRELLVRMGLAGAVAGCLIEATALGKYAWLPWQKLRDGRVSYPWAELYSLGSTKFLIDFNELIAVADDAAKEAA